MNNYVSPVIFDNDELAEGVYASGSGQADCWTLTFEEKQRVTTNPGWNYVEYEITAIHHTGLEHISSALEVVCSISGDTVTRFNIEGNEVIPGTTHNTQNYEIFGNQTAVTIKRIHLADAYKSGDRVTFKLGMYCNNGAEVLNGLMWTCTHETNVQGKYD